MVDASGTTKYTYTAGNQLLTEDGPWANDTVTYGYNNRLRTSLNLQQPAGAWTNGLAYDPARRVTNLTSQSGTSSYSYAPGIASRRYVKLSLPSAYLVTNQYDSVARLTNSSLYQGTNALTPRSIYTYNQAGQRKTSAAGWSPSYTYTYDQIGQLTLATNDNWRNVQAYAYDSAWNLMLLTNPAAGPGFGTNFTVDAKNETVSQLISTSAYTNSFDANGNLISRISTSGSTNRTFAYDDENRLTNITSATRQYDLTYDGFSRLRKQTVYSGSPSVWTFAYEIRYIYDGNLVIQERDTNNTPSISYTRGTDLSGTFQGAGGIGGMLARSSGYVSGNWSSNYFYHADSSGNITFLIGSNQDVGASYSYDPFGTVIQVFGPLQTANTYRFSSKEITSAGYYFGYRFYDLSLQRWLNRDPAGMFGGLNLYSYVGNRAPNFVDPLGLDPVTGAVVGIGVGTTIGTGSSGGAGVTITVVGGSGAGGLGIAEIFPPLAAATLVGAVGVGVIEGGSRLLWPDPGPAPLPLPRRPPKPPKKPICPEPPYPKECDIMRDGCVGSGQDCFSCWRECQSTGSWPSYKCDPSKWGIGPAYGGK